MIRIDKVNEYVNTLMANLSFKADYQTFLRKKGEKARLLIVEGATDEKFIKKIINPNVACMIAKKAFFKRPSFGIEKREDAINCKSAIVQLVYGLSRVPQLISCEGSGNWVVYGMIDLDYDDEDLDMYRNTNQLFVTDTHDLETLLLSTDNELLQRLKKCTIKEVDIKRAFSASYQIGLVKSLLIDYYSGINLSALSSGTVNVSYNEFIDDEGMVSINNLVNYVCNNGNEITSKKAESIIAKILKDKRIKKKTNGEGKWNWLADCFDYVAYDDFWDVVNGHDILSLLKYYNRGVAKAYSGNILSIDREFEFDLIDNYEYSCLEKTNLYRNMYSNKIVKEIQ